MRVTPVALEPLLIFPLGAVQSGTVQHPPTLQLLAKWMLNWSPDDAQGRAWSWTLFAAAVVDPWSSSC